MPTYDYKCSSCSHIFEVFQSIKAEPLKICPNCGGEIKRIISAGSGPIFKGTGFYQTDYKNKSNASKENESKNNASKDNSSKTSKPEGDSKPSKETKKEDKT